MDTRLDHLTLRDLRLLATLLDTRSLARTAEALGLSQPAASRIVAKLRRVLGDPLLVRTTAGGALTPRGYTLIAEVAAAMAAVERVFTADRFDPLTTTKAIRIAATDYGASVVAAPLAAHLAVTAPGMTLEIVGYSSETFETLASGALDLALYADAALPPDFHALDLFEETYACVVRASHPALVGTEDEPMSEALVRLLDYPRAAMLYPDGHRLRGDDVLADLASDGLPPVSFATPFFLSAGPAIARSDMSLCLPARAARLLAETHSLYVIPLGGDRGFPYRLVWHERTHGDACQQWVRTVIGDLTSPGCNAQRR